MSDKLIYVRPEVYDIIKARAKQNSRPICMQVELDVTNQMNLENY
jgi:hypothetical protein